MTDFANDFTDQAFIVTGATGNLGQAVARTFAAANANLTLVDIAGDRLSETLPELAASGTHFLNPDSVDVTDPDAFGAVVQASIERFGRIDGLLNTVGGFRMGPAVHELDLDDWDFMLNLNARSVLVTCRAVLPHLLEAGRGRIVSVAARSGLTGYGWMAPYSVSKSAVIRLTEAIAEEVKDSDINVNCVLPGTIDTPQNRTDMPKADHSKWVPPEQIARVFAFLASDAAAAINGAAIPVYGRS